MKNKAIRLGKYATLFLMMLLVGYSCSDDNPVVDYDKTEFKIVNITVKKADWKWDDFEQRYDAVYNLTELTQFIYENGAVLGYVFIGQKGKNELQKTLPFIHTYLEKDDGGNDFLYTETISFDFEYGSPSTVAFYIQGSDLGKDDFNLADYNFRLVLISK